MTAVLWAAVAWIMGAVAIRLRPTFVHPRHHSLLTTSALFAAGVLALAWSPGDGLLSHTLAATAVLAGAQSLRERGEGHGGLETAAGALLVLSPLCLPVWGLLWAICYVALGYPALARVVASLLTPVCVGFYAGWPLALAAVPVALMLALHERPAIRRILLGTGRRHGWRPQT
jgi:glycerol-3-phosphate acyltransferase PlsY